MSTTSIAQFNLGSSNSPTFTLGSGRYAIVAVSSAWGGGNIDLQILGPDGSTFVSILSSQFTANGALLVDLPAGTYQFIVTTATGCWASANPVR